MSEASQEAIKQARQIDSPYMQNILKTLESTVNDLSPEDIPQFTLLEAPMSPTVTDGATRAVSYTTAYGFDDCFTTLSPIKFKVTSYDTSAFRQSNLLGNVFYYDKDLDYTVIFYAYNIYVEFLDPITYIYPIKLPPDYIGYNPDEMPPVSSINNDTSLTKGFSITPLIPRVLYMFTTYGISFGITEPGYAVDNIMIPLNDYKYKKTIWPEVWGTLLEWNYYSR